MVFAITAFSLFLFFMLIKLLPRNRGILDIIPSKDLDLSCPLITMTLIMQRQTQLENQSK